MHAHHLQAQLDHIHRILDQKILMEVDLEMEVGWESDLCLQELEGFSSLQVA
jgi:hypothetical protein